MTNLNRSILIRTPLFLIFCISIFIFESHGQSTKDSLVHAINFAEHDTTKARLMLDLGDEIVYSDPSEALQNFNSAQEIALAYQDTYIIVNSYIGLCDVYSYMEESNTAIHYAFEGLEASGNSYYLQALCHNRIAIEYYQLNDVTKSLQHDKLSLKYNELDSNIHGVAYDMHNLGTFFLDNYQFDSAYYYYHASNTFLDDSMDVLWGYNLSRLGLNYFYSNDYKQALRYHQRAYSLFKELDIQYDIANEEYYLAQIYTAIGEYDKGIDYCEKSLERIVDIQVPSLSINIYDKLMHIYSLQGDYKNALKYSKWVSAYSDSTYTKNKKDLLKGVEIKKQFDEQNHLLELAETENENLQHNENLYTIILILAIIAILISAIFIFVQNRQSRKNKQLLKDLNFANESKSKLLRIIGHDLIGSVGNLKRVTELIANNNITESQTKTLMPNFISVVDSAYNLVDNILTWSRVSAEKGITFSYKTLKVPVLAHQTIQHLIHLAQLKNIKIDNQAEDICFQGDRNMMLTIIRNLLSNAIKFSSPDTTIIIGAQRYDDYVEIFVKDEGVGMTQEHIAMALDDSVQYHSKGTVREPGSGMGISLCKFFIEKHNGKMIIESVPEKGSTFRCQFPLPTECD